MGHNVIIVSMKNNIKPINYNGVEYMNLENIEQISLKNSETFAIMSNDLNDLKIEKYVKFDFIFIYVYYTI